MKFEFDNLADAPLVVDAIYEGGSRGNASDDVLSKLLKVGIQGDFRWSGHVKNPRYCILYTDGAQPDWPDEIDLRLGQFIYFGDNRKPGRLLNEPLGNKILEHAFESLHSSEDPRNSVCPFLIFEKCPTENSSRSARFRGLAVPGFAGLTSAEDLVAVWRSKNGSRFQNYRAVFSILDCAEISRDWLDGAGSVEPPDVWAHWKNTGIASRLVASPVAEVRTKEEQTPTSLLGQQIIKRIRDYFDGRDTDFEPFAAYVFSLFHRGVIIDEVTRKTSDGGRDAIGRLALGSIGDPIYLDFALEAKCFAPPVLGENGTSVRTPHTSRLISRLKHRQFGVLVTTSFLDRIAYRELREDGHPVIVISGSDIVAVLRAAGFGDLASLERLLSGY